MGSSDAPVVPIPFGGFSADAVLGKTKGFSPDIKNMRFDLFDGIQSILGNTAYNSNKCGGNYNLGGDVFQFVRKDGTYDVVLSRLKAESKVYKVPASAVTNTVVLSSDTDFNAGTPGTGDSILTIGTGLKQTALSGVGSVILNPSFETGDFTNWTNNGYLTISTTSPYSGTYLATGTITVPQSAYVTIMDNSGGFIIAYTLPAQDNWTKYVIPDTALTAYIGTNIKIRFLGDNEAISDAFTYQGDNISFYYKLITVGSHRTFYVDFIQTYFSANKTLKLGTTATSFDYGVTPTSLGNFTANCTCPTGTSLAFQIQTSADNITYPDGWKTIATVTTTSMSTTALSGVGGLTARRYYQLRFIPTLSGDLIPTFDYAITGGQWVSAIQNAGAVPAAWGTFTAVSTLNSQTISYEMDTSVDGGTWDGYAAITSGSAPTNTLRQFFRFRATFNTTSTAQIPLLTSLTLLYTLAAAGGSLVQLTGFSGTGWDQYFCVLNNLLLISDGSTAPMTWSGTGTAFAATTGSPSGTYSCTHYDRAFLAYSSANPSRIWWSNLKDPTVWDTTNQYIDINPDDGDFITGIVSYGGVLYVFKRKMAYMIQGNDFNIVTGNITIQPMPQLPGTESHKSIAVGSDGNLYWYSRKGVVQFTGSSLPNFIGKGIIDKTVKAAGFTYSSSNYNTMNTVDFTRHDEIWFSFGHIIYTFNYTLHKWSRILFDNNSTGNGVYSLTPILNLYSDNILSFTGNNVIELWDDTATLYVGALPTPAQAIQSHYLTDFLDGQWYYSKNYYKLLLSTMPLTATSITTDYYVDFGATSISTQSKVCPTTAIPNQYQRFDIPSGNGKRMQIKISCTALQMGISDMAAQQEIVPGGEL